MLRRKKKHLTGDANDARCSGRLSILLDALWDEPSEYSHASDPSRVAFELAVKYAMFIIINFYIFHYVIFF